MQEAYRLCKKFQALMSKFVFFKIIAVTRFSVCFCRNFQRKCFGKSKKLFSCLFKRHRVVVNGPETLSA